MALYGLSVQVRFLAVISFIGTANGYVRVDGGAVRIDVDANGMPWVVTSFNDIYRRVRDHWEQVPAKAVDIGIGADGSVWIIGTGRIAGNNDIWRWNGSGWTQVSGAAIRIDVDDAGNPWVVNKAGVISKWNGSGWVQPPGMASDISVGGGSTWIIGTNSIPGGYNIYKWNSQRHNWDRIPGSGVAVSVGRRGHHPRATSNVPSSRLDS